MLFLAEFEIKLVRRSDYLLLVSHCDLVLLN